MAAEPKDKREAEASRFTVLLVGNYLPDGQRSMQRFTAMLESGLHALEQRVAVFRPPLVFGRLGASGRGFGKWIGYLDKYLLAPFALRARLRKIQGPCVVHVIDHSNAPYLRWLQDHPHLLTCHDLLAVRSALGEIEQNRPGFTGRRQQAMILRGLKSARCIASVSAATREDVRRLVGDRPELLRLVPNALDPRFSAAAAENAPSAPQPAASARLPDGAAYLLHVGGEKWYKNRAAVLRIFARIAERQPKLHLLAVGPDFSAGQLEESGAAACAERIRCIQGADDEELLALYTHARLLLFPSWQEGFGWPIVEAQACGCPVLTLDRPPMSELNATPELRCPLSGDWVREAADRALPFCALSPEERARLTAGLRESARVFSNEASARAYLDLYRELLEHRPSP